MEENGSIPRNLCTDLNLFFFFHRFLFPRNLTPHDEISNVIKSSFSAIHKVGNVGIFVLLKFELSTELSPIYFHSKMSSRSPLCITRKPQIGRTDFFSSAMYRRLKLADLEYKRIMHGIQNSALFCINLSILLFPRIGHHYKTDSEECKLVFTIT